MRPLMLLGAASLLGGCTAGPEVGFRTLRGEIAVFPAEEVQFGDVVVLTPFVLPLQIQNAGSGELVIEELVLDDPHDVFTVDPAGATIEREGEWTVPIQFQPATYLDYEASLTIRSSDEDTPELVVPLRGRGVDAPMPDIAVDPLTLDFGTVAAGSAAVQFLQIENEGTAPLRMGVVGQTGSGAFQLTTDPSHALIDAGLPMPVVITYAPGNDLGDSGWLTFPSDDPDEPEVEVLLLGNGGGDFDYPEAVIDCVGTSAPPGWVTLDGSASTDPLGGDLDYLWTLVSKPAGSAGYLLQTVTDATELYTDIAGTYEVQLLVTNAQGTSGAPARCFIEAVPEDDLHVELTWDAPDHDLDLHLVEDGSTLFDSVGDCHYCNKNPSWGAAGTADDPRLDLDDQYDGPENINILDPADGRYHVKVHYYEGSGAVTATVKVWANGAEVYTASKVMSRNDVWDVGQVNWPEATVAPANTALYPSPRRSCE